MVSPGCERFLEDLSGYADGTLPRKRWEQVSYHLAGCVSCRIELAAISSVCSELSQCGRASAPDALAARLESIAGEHAGMPLYMANGTGALPSARRTRNRWAANGGVALLAAVMSALVMAVLIAPELPRLSDPVKTAREQYSMSTSAVTINEAVGAVLLAYERGADFGESVTYGPRESAGRRLAVTPLRASELLLAAAGSETSLTGTQQVWVSDGTGGYRHAEVRTTKVAGEGAQLEVLDARGDRFMSSFLPELGAPTVQAPTAWDFSETVATELVNGRLANHLVAEADGAPAAAWWFDADTGILLWAERYDASGAVTLATGYRDVRLGAAALGENLTQHIALKPVSASQTDGWCVGLPECPLEAAGLPLVAYSSSERQGSRAMTLVYSDGFESAVVGWSEGVLVGEAKRILDQRAGMPTVEVWQAGEAVIWVSTNGTEALHSAIASTLPGEAAPSQSLFSKVKAGFERLVDVG